MSDNRYKVRLIDGRLYDPWSPSGSTPSPETVAQGLAGLCRYGAHVRRFYSVAEHCIWVALRLLTDGAAHASRTFEISAAYLATGGGAVAFNLLTPTPARFRLALLGLVHDAPEGCGLVDVLGPILRHEAMAEYKAAHERCANWLLDGWGIARPNGVEIAWVKEIDTSILGAEMSIRPPCGDGVVGSGESLPKWTEIDLSGEHDLSKNAHSIYVRETWIDAFHILKERAK